MVNEKTNVDQWVRREIEKLGIIYTEQKSSIKEVNAALKNASKQGGKGSGKPEFIFLVNETLIVVEDKHSQSNLVLLDENGELDLSIPKGTANYAVNGAVHYAKCIAEKTNNFKEVIAIGAVGTSESGSSLVYHVSNDHEFTTIKRVGTLSDWEVLSPVNFDEWYGVNVLGDLSKDQKAELELKKIAAQLHEDLRNYASLEGENKATVISAILLALDSGNISIDELKGHRKPTDGARIYRSIKDYMEDKNILPEEKRNIVLNKFNFIQTNVAINEKRNDLGMTPIRYFASVLQSEVLNHFKTNTDFDILGNFYGEFVKYGGSDGNGLGIVLTPKHITSLMAEIIQIGRSDYVLDPTAGSGSFLISAMNRMMKDPLTEGSNNTDIHIKQHQLFGIEMQEKMYTVATTNMILRGDGKSNLMLASMFSKTADDIISDGNKVQITKVLMNPPYSQGSQGNPNLYEINFIKHALDMTAQNGKIAVIVPQSTMTGKSKVEKEIKKAILESNTLDAVITLNPNTFHGQRAGVQPVIAIFTAKHPHPEQKQVKFINFKDDGWVVKKHIGLQDDGTASVKRKQLVDAVLYDVPSEISFMVKSSITSEDEWLHSYFYFNDSIPTPESFEKTVQDYISFKFDQTVHGRGYLFEEEVESTKKVDPALPKISEVEWGAFTIQEIFNVIDGFYNKKPPMTNGHLPFLGATENNNGITGFTDITTVSHWSKTGDSTNSTLEKKIFGPNWLAVTNNGSVGNVYFVETTYTSSHDVTSLSLKNKDINKEIGLFLSCILKEAGKPFSYGRKWRPKRMRTTPILLPLDKDKNPNWDYMEQYIVNILKMIDVPELEPAESSSIDLNSVRWHEFRIDEVMEVLNGVRLTSYDMTPGTMPFIGSSDSNNGITNWTSDINSSTDSNVLGINYNGSVGEVFYHPYSATFSDDVKRLKLKNHSFGSKEVYLFIKTMLLQQKDKYAYGYKFNGARMKTQKIMLPVKESNEPDWEFMENYINSISNSHLL